MGTVYYSNVDSIFVHVNDIRKIDLPMGIIPGQFKTEYTNVIRFVSVAPRSYYLVFLDSEGRANHIVKSCGLSFSKMAVTRQISLEEFGSSIEDFLHGVLNEQTIQQPRKKRKGHTAEVVLVPHTLRHAWYTNRVLLKNEQTGQYHTEPYGYK